MHSSRNLIGKCVAGSAIERRLDGSFGPKLGLQDLKGLLKGLSRVFQDPEACVFDVSRPISGPKSVVKELSQAVRGP
jgi:hypothetical protein